MNMLPDYSLDQMKKKTPEVKRHAYGEYSFAVNRYLSMMNLSPLPVLKAFDYDSLSSSICPERSSWKNVIGMLG